MNQTEKESLKDSIKKWLRNTSNNIVSSIIASIVFTFLLNKAEWPSNLEKYKSFLLLGLLFIFLSVLLFGAIKIFSKKTYPKVKAIVFDFDGTLSRCNVPDLHSTWELIWKELGYKVSDCHDLYKRFKANEFKHQEWCDKTCRAFQKKEMSPDKLRDVAQYFELYDGVKDVLDNLKQDGIKLYLISGSIVQLIQYIWDGDIYKYFDDIKANIFRFENDKLIEIVGTKYDFEGKAEFIRNIYRNEKLNSPGEILFIGNSDNDEFAYKSGAQTLCVNPRLVNPNNKKIWHESLRFTDYKELLDFIERKYL